MAIPPGASLLELKRQGGWQRWERVARYSHAVPPHDRRTLPNPLQKTAFGQLLHAGQAFVHRLKTERRAVRPVVADESGGQRGNRTPTAKGG